MSNNKFTQEIFKAMAGTVIKTIGQGPNVDDVVSDAAIRVLTGQFDESRGSFKSYCCMIAASTAKNFRAWKSLAPNDAISEGHDDGSGVATQLIDDLVGIDGRDVVSASSDSRRLAAAIATLEGDEKLFINAILSDIPAIEAVKLTSWKSQADATRKMTSICSKLRHAM
jgi:DNA-directed RNA polymerase specialized sigma24 family protein